MNNIEIDAKKMLKEDFKVTINLKGLKLAMFRNRVAFFILRIAAFVACANVEFEFDNEDE